MNWAEKINQFNSNLNLKVNLPRGIAVMNPFRNPYTQTLSQAFYSKYYSDKNPRTLILGINPGRFGAGLTGIPFTDPLKLENLCDIQNTLPKKSELSADFIYLMIEKAGGIKQFYKQFYFSSVCPLGFTRGGKNLNYYDDIILQEK
ncbi:MAG: DUF4918 family protein [Flammeovirgaceae bacterium]|nr:DUF4918 family protein [Flammeovirgaceae bacterium]